MKLRLITGITLALILVPAFYFGGTVLTIVLLLLTMGASYELFNMFNSKNNFGRGIMVTFIILSIILYYAIQSYYDVNSSVRLDWAFMMIISIVFVGSMLLVIVPKFSVDNLGEVLVSVLYPALGFGAVYGIASAGVYHITFLFLITISTDIFAYVFGMNFGKHRLAEHISPKKSIEGSIGGTLSALVITMVYLWIFNIDYILSIELNVFNSIALILLISVFGQIGDLVASKMKRNYEIKDFSNIFPGHGGVLDRFDSAIYAGMILMLLSEFIGALLS